MIVSHVAAEMPVLAVIVLSMAECNNNLIVLHHPRPFCLLDTRHGGPQHDLLLLVKGPNRVSPTFLARGSGGDLAVW